MNLGKLNIVVIGGGAGVPIVLQGLKDYDVNLTAIVSVTDSGRSSGILRKELGVLPPGDIRNCLLALSKADDSLKSLFRYRFSESSLAGMNLGNLFIAALAKMEGSFDKAVKKISRLLKVKGKVLPASLDDVHLCAELLDGTIVEEEINVRKPNKPPIKKIFLIPKNAKPSKEVLDEIEKAELIVIGPGSLYTSVITNLLIKDLTKAIKSSKAKKVFVCNIMTQPGQTDNYTVSQHVRAIEEYLGKNILDYIIINTGTPSKKILEGYRKKNAFLVKIDKENLNDIKAKIIQADVVDKKLAQKLWQKTDLLKHDSKKIAKALMKIALT